jgi:MoxR-like ATPase
VLVDAGPATLAEAQRAVATVIRGKDDVIELALVAMLAGGHVLIEDIPGVGKSTLARALAAVIGGEFRRIQFTSDLLPADVLGVKVWLPREQIFELRKGPIFAHVVLADEINRAPPRTQSALLEALGEAQVSIDGESHALPRPFLVLATQNPQEHHGTYPLPESQKDRFLLRLEIGYVEAEIETALLRAGSAAPDLAAVLTPEQLFAAQEASAAVFLHEDLARYAQRVVAATRDSERIRLGVSTRGAMAWVAGARARAHLRGRSHVTIEDLQALAGPALAHRLVPAGPASADPALAEELVADIVAAVPVPI